ncbi:MAG: ABC transporter permease [Gammaproteobacteria bacterium]|nr:ABC transporter permease [Gammaproteobacteria bacterium]
MVVITQLLLTLAFGATVAFVCCWIRDLTFVIRSGLLLMMFCSGIFFAVERMPPAYQEVFRLNPMALLIEDYRTVLLDGVVPEFLPCLRIGLFSLVWLYLMKRAYSRWDLTLTRHVLA